MTYQMTVSPDFTPDRIAGWFIFNNWLQRKLGEQIHLQMHDSFERLHAAIAADEVDLIYANAYDAAMLVRSRGFVAVAREQGKSDEAVIVVRADSPAHKVEDLAPGVRAAVTDGPDVNLMCMIMIEPANLHAENVTRVRCDGYVPMAKALLRGTVDMGYFLQDAYQSLSATVRRELRPLVASQISVIQHVLLAGPRFQARLADLKSALDSMHQEEKGRDALASLGFARWDLVEQEDVEFMIDLMDTLQS